MNIVYYIAGQINHKNNIKYMVTGGHGYSFDPSVEGKKRLAKNVPTPYGYYVEAEHQNVSVIPVDFYSGRVCGEENIGDAFLLNIKSIIEEWLNIKGEKLLIVSGLPKLTSQFLSGRKFKNCNEELYDEVRDMYVKNKSNILIDLSLYPKGGEGPKQAHNQANLSFMLSTIPINKEVFLDKQSDEEYRKQEIDFNKIVTASRWYFNTGDSSTFYDLCNGRRVYHFGRVDPDKNYYGKETPDVYYSALYTKEPIKVLDTLFNFCKKYKPNPYNLLSAGNLNNIRSKEIAKVINILPGMFQDNEMISPMKVGTNENPALVEVIDPPGLSYRIRDQFLDLDDAYKKFLKRDSNNEIGKLKFVDITEKFFIKEKDKYKIHPEFSNTVLSIPVLIDSPDCKNKVRINLSVKLDCPGRNEFNSLIKDKVDDIKVWLGLDFCNEAGVVYFTLVETPDFDYIHTNSIANLKVYNLKELGK